VARTDDGGLPVGRPVRVRLVTADPQRRQIRLRRVTRAAGAESRRS
jgi:hypothetical protein